MVIVEIDEKSVFLYDAEDLSVAIYDFREGKHKGGIIGQVGKVKFADMEQLSQFREMLDFIEEKNEKTRNPDNLTR